MTDKIDTTLTSETAQRAARIADFIKPLRVKPGSKVNLSRDFDPSYKAGLLKKKNGVELLQAGVTLLADYQHVKPPRPARKAAARTRSGVPA